MTSTARTLLGALMASLVMLAAIGASTASAAPTPAPADFYGANIQAMVRLGFVKPAAWPTFLHAGQQAGLTIARFDAAWNWAEPNAPVREGIHKYDWTKLDNIAATLAAQNLRWLPVVDLPPAWATTANDELPAEHQDDFAAFAGAFAARYGEGGTFWAAHPELPQLPIQQTEVWTEANSSHFWSANPDPAAYLALVVKVRTAMKAADPNISVLISLGWQDFVGFANSLYDAGMKGSTDGVAFHPYAPTARGVVVLTRKLRDTLALRGEPDLPIYMTEVGWPKAASGPGAYRAYDGPVSDQSRAATAALAADALAASDCNVKDYLFYSLVEQQKDPSNIEDWLGLFNADGSPTETLDALAGSAQRWSYAGAKARTAATPSLLPLCHGPTNDKAVASNTMPPNGQLPVQLSWPVPVTTPCTTFQARYYGDPLEDVSVFIRTYRGNQAGAVTRAAGQAQLCMSKMSRRKPFLVWSRSGGLASSPVQSCRGSRCYPVYCRRASLTVKSAKLAPRKFRLKLAVKCGKRLMFGEPVKVNGIDLKGRPKKLKAFKTGTKTNVLVVQWSPKLKFRSLKIRFGGDKTFQFPARVRRITLTKAPRRAASSKPVVPTGQPGVTGATPASNGTPAK